MRGPGLSDVRGKWPGKELVGMNFVGSAKAGREGETSGGEAGGARAQGRLAGAQSRGAGERQAWACPRPQDAGRAGVATRAPPPRPAPAAWHGSKRAPDCYALCFLLRAEPGGMRLAQAVSLPRGGGTLKGQRPLPAAAGPPLPSPTPPASRPLHPHREAQRRPEPGRGPQGVRGAAPEVALPGGRGWGDAGHVPREPGGQEVRLRAGIGRLGRAGPCARRRAGAVRRERGESLGEKHKEKERAAGSLWVPGASS